MSQSYRKKSPSKSKHLYHSLAVNSSSTASCFSAHRNYVGNKQGCSRRKRRQDWGTYFYREGKQLHWHFGTSLLRHRSLSTLAIIKQLQQIKHHMCSLKWQHWQCIFFASSTQIPATISESWDAASWFTCHAAQCRLRIAACPFLPGTRNHLKYKNNKLNERESVFSDI